MRGFRALLLGLAALALAGCAGTASPEVAAEIGQPATPVPAFAELLARWRRK